MAKIFDWIFPFILGIVFTYLVMSILLDNKKYSCSKFNDTGALMQLKASEPYIFYVNSNKFNDKFLPFNN